jgi:hypothetical protein
VHAGEAPVQVASPAEALALARDTARAQAIARARAFGAIDPAVELRVDRIDLPFTDGDAGLVAATVVAECWGAGAG